MASIRKSFIVSCFSLIILSLSAQTLTDSLKRLLLNESGVNRLVLLQKIAENSLSGNINESIIYADSMMKDAVEMKNMEMIAIASGIQGEAHYYQGDTKLAIELFEKMLKIARKLKDMKQISSAYNNLGIVYTNIDIIKGLAYYQKSLRIKRALNDTSGISAALNNIGALYDKHLKDYPKALEYYSQSLQMDLKREDEEGIATSLLNLGDVKRKMGAFREAIDSCIKSIKISEKKHFGYLLELNYESLYKSYDSLRDYKNAYLYLGKFLDKKLDRLDEDLRKQVMELEIKYNTAEQSRKITIVQKEQKIQRLIIYSLILVLVLIVYFLRLLSGKNKKINRANEILSTMNSEIRGQKEILEKQAKVLERTNDELLKLSVVASKTDNSVIVANADGEIEWVNDGFERMLGIDFEEFARRYSSNFFKASLHPNIREALDEAIKTRQSFNYSSYTVTRKGREIWIHTTLTPIIDEYGKLQKIIAIDADVTRIKNAELKLANKQQEVTDSITYAKNIQVSMLPPDSLFEESFKEHFILYRPKDIVSGDFYWLRKMHDILFFAVADCTGHGIPGAFMSILGISLLNEIINGIPSASEIPKAGKILGVLRDNMKTALRQHGNNSIMSDGMDIGLCLINTSKHYIDFSGAYHHLFHIRQSEDGSKLLEYQGDKMPIGVYPNDHLPFTTYHIGYNKSDTFYLFTDGYIHQWGGSEGKKFNRRRFRESLLIMSKKSLSAQKEELEYSLDQWIQTPNQDEIKEFQVDDILVTGFRI